jgi:F-type H+-transporting ATPase subunit b
MFATPDFWVLVAFVIFIALVAKKLNALIGAALDGRTARIKAQLDEAEKLRADAEAALADYRQRQRDAIKGAEDILTQARSEASALEADYTTQIEQRLKRREAQALDKIAQAEAAAIAEVRNQAVDLALAATRRVLVEKVDGGIASGLIDNAIQELPQRLRA